MLAKQITYIILTLSLGLSVTAKKDDGGCDGGSGKSKATTVTTDTTATTTSGSAASTGTQFITGPCKGDDDCASGCCGFKSGKCAGAIIAQSRDGGCGFGNDEPNDIAAKKLEGQSSKREATSLTTVTTTTTAAASATTTQNL